MNRPTSSAGTVCTLNPSQCIDDAPNHSVGPQTLVQELTRSIQARQYRRHAELQRMAWAS
jgi:hypothetical protein